MFALLAVNNSQCFSTQDNVLNGCVWSGIIVLFTRSVGLLPRNTPTPAPDLWFCCCVARVHSAVAPGKKFFSRVCSHGDKVSRKSGCFDGASVGVLRWAMTRSICTAMTRVKLLQPDWSKKIFVLTTLSRVCYACMMLDKCRTSKDYWNFFINFFRVSNEF